jgi:pimeloyl-ACP methyl ester carboxylesterase
VRLLLGGAPHEGGPSPAELELLRARLRSFEVARVPHAGHFIFEEAPDAVVEAIRCASHDAALGPVSRATAESR